MPRFFTFSGMRTYIATRHSEDSLRLFAIAVTHMAMIVDHYEVGQAVQLVSPTCRDLDSEVQGWRPILAWISQLAGLIWGNLLAGAG